MGFDPNYHENLAKRNAARAARDAKAAAERSEDEAAALRSGPLSPLQVAALGVLIARRDGPPVHERTLAKDLGRDTHPIRTMIALEARGLVTSHDRSNYDCMYRVTRAGLDAAPRPHRAPDAPARPRRAPASRAKPAQPVSLTGCMTLIVVGFVLTLWLRQCAAAP